MSEHPDSNKVSARTQEVVTLNNEPEKSAIEPTPREDPSVSQVQASSHSPEKKSEIQESSKEDRIEANEIVHEAVPDVESEQAQQPNRSSNQEQSARP